MNKKFYAKIVFIFIISFLIQIIFIGAFRTFLARDALYYDSMASNILKGKGFSDDGVIPSVNVKPGYVLFLTLIYKIFGHNLYLVRIFQAIFVSLTCVIIFLIGDIVFNTHDRKKSCPIWKIPASGRSGYDMDGQFC